jgi:hypothetical protein
LRLTLQNIMRSPTPGTPYTPDFSRLPEGLPRDMAWGVRTIYAFRPEGQTQYIVFNAGFNAENDPNCNNVIGSGSTEFEANHSAIRNWQIDQVRPANFWPRLEGCTFVKRVEPGKVALQHVCLGPDGAELARADFSETAAKIALHRVLYGCTDVTFEEFKATTVVAMVQRPSLGKSYGLVYCDSVGQDAVRAMLHASFMNNTDIQEAAASISMLNTLACAEGTDAKTSKVSDIRRPRRDVIDQTLCTEAQKDIDRQQVAFNALMQEFNKAMLSIDKGTDLNIYTINEGGAWFARVVLHSPALNTEQALHHAYQEYLSDVENSVETETAVEAISA